MKNKIIRIKAFLYTFQLWCSNMKLSASVLFLGRPFFTISSLCFRVQSKSRRWFALNSWSWWDSCNRSFLPQQSIFFLVLWIFSTIHFYHFTLLFYYYNWTIQKLMVAYLRLISLSSFTKAMLTSSCFLLSLSDRSQCLFNRSLVSFSRAWFYKLEQLCSL